MGVVNFDWDDAAVEKLKSLYDQGLSASQIAYQFGGKMTRNMVLGKVNRLHLTPRQTQLRWALPRLHVVKAMPKPAPPPAEAPQLYLVENQAVTIETLQHGMCKWPYGDGAGIKFCGNPSEEHKPYCGFHMTVSRPPQQAKSKNA